MQEHTPTKRILSKLTSKTRFSRLIIQDLVVLKAKYDPNDFFIVKSGVGSERWDSDGLCRVENQVALK